jgi:hypothetical protein
LDGLFSKKEKMKVREVNQIYVGDLVVIYSNVPNQIRANKRNGYNKLSAGYWLYGLFLFLDGFFYCFGDLSFRVEVTIK